MQIHQISESVPRRGSIDDDNRRFKSWADGIGVIGNWMFASKRSQRLQLLNKPFDVYIGRGADGLMAREVT
jgi:hypothetical protein